MLTPEQDALIQNAVEHGEQALAVISVPSSNKAYERMMGIAEGVAKVAAYEGDFSLMYGAADAAAKLVDDGQKQGRANTLVSAAAVSRSEVHAAKSLAMAKMEDLGRIELYGLSEFVVPADVKYITYYYQTGVELWKRFPDSILLKNTVAIASTLAQIPAANKIHKDHARLVFASRPPEQAATTHLETHKIGSSALKVADCASFYDISGDSIFLDWAIDIINIATSHHRLLCDYDLSRELIDNTRKIYQRLIEQERTEDATKLARSILHVLDGSRGARGKSTVELYAELTEPYPETPALESVPPSKYFTDDLIPLDEALKIANLGEQEEAISRTVVRLGNIVAGETAIKPIVPISKTELDTIVQPIKTTRKGAIIVPDYLRPYVGNRRKLTPTK